MTQMTAEQIAAALKAKIITQEQAQKMRAQLDSTAIKNTVEAENNYAAIGNEDDLKFIRGFSDIFIAIGVGLLLFGLFGVLQTQFGGRDMLLGAPAFIGSAICWALAEYFGRKKRAHLPTFLITFAFWAFTASGFFGIFSDADNTVLGIIFATLGILIAMGIYYMRIKFPYCISTITITGLALIIAILYSISRNLILDNFALILMLCGIITIGFGVYYDMKDVKRVTRFSDNAFWLHLHGAPLLVHGLVWQFVTKSGALKLSNLRNLDNHASTATGILCIVGFMCLLGLTLNRRALVVSSLLYAIASVLYLVAKAGLSGNMALMMTLAIIGSAIILLGVGWDPIRNRLIKILPKSPFIPPANYD